MSDHADTIRRYVCDPGQSEFDADDAEQALDALLAENQRQAKEIDRLAHDLADEADATDKLEAENQQLRDALRTALREWEAWMESARLGYDDEKPSQDDFDVFAEIAALAAVRVEDDRR